MKILIYLEPHPIRNRFESFGFIGQKFVDMLRDEYLCKTNSRHEPHEVRILLSRHYWKIINSNQDMLPVFLGMTCEENDAIELMKKEWNSDPQAIEDWVGVMSGRGEAGELYKNILTRVHNEVYRFDVLVNWSTNGAVRSFCENRGIENVSMELGCTRNPIYDSLYFDAHGINGNAISRYIDLEMVQPMDQDVLRVMLPTKTNQEKSSDSLHNAIASKYADDIYHDVNKNILIPLQLKDDSNCILYSDYKCMLDMLHDLLPKLTSSGYRCFIKPHPSAGDRPINMTDHDACMDYAQEFEDGVYWLDDIQQNRDYLALLNKMKYVITVNSSTGFEAMLYGKIVVPLGEAPYRIGTDFPHISDLINNEINEEKYHAMSSRIVTFMTMHYLTPHAMGFNFPYFIHYLQRAIHSRNLLFMKGSEAMTRHMLSEAYIDFDIRDRIMAKREIHARFDKYSTSKSGSLKTTPPVQVSATVAPITPNDTVVARPTADGTPDAKARKWRKLRRDPAKFLVDSRNPILKQIGLLMGGQP